MLTLLSGAVCRDVKCPFPALNVVIPILTALLGCGVGALAHAIDTEGALPLWEKFKANLAPAEVKKD